MGFILNESTFSSNDSPSVINILVYEKKRYDTLNFNICCLSVNHHPESTLDFYRLRNRPSHLNDMLLIQRNGLEFGHLVKGKSLKNIRYPLKKHTFSWVVLAMSRNTVKIITAKRVRQSNLNGNFISSHKKKIGQMTRKRWTWSFADSTK